MIKEAPSIIFDLGGEDFTKIVQTVKISTELSKVFNADIENNTREDISSGISWTSLFFNIYDVFS
jgi:hypothetical protein